MADKEVGSLTSAGTLDGTELVHVVKSGNSRQTTAQDIADLGGGGGIDWGGMSALAYTTFVSGTDRLVVYDVSGTTAHYMTGDTLFTGIVADMTNGGYNTLSGYMIPMASGSNLRKTTLSTTQSATFEQIGTDTDIQTGEYLLLYGGGITQRITFANFANALLNDIDTDDISEGATNLFYPAADASKLAGIETGAEVNTVDSVNGLTGAVVLDPDDLDDTATINKFTTAADISKLAGIETGADVTDATNVATAGAAMLNTENQTLTGGATVTSKSLGTQSSGTLTLDMGDRPIQHYTNNGAHTLAPGTVNGSCLVDITNGASAGAITTSGWTQVAGDDFDTTNANKFRCHCSVGNAGSLLIVQAMQ